MPLVATRALYIKLGEGNKWANLSFQTRTLRFGFSDTPHQLVMTATENDDFQPVKDFYLQDGVGPSTATRFTNEVREFYTAAEDVIWITFADGRLWWCFAATHVNQLVGEDLAAIGSRSHQTIGEWSDKDVLGNKLWINTLRGSLTTTAGFRGTICRVKEFDYLLRRLNGQETSATGAVRSARAVLINSLAPLIAGLHWRDFELLTELIMTQGGWRRVSETGGTQQTVDLELELPLTGERALVQVKSNLNQTSLESIMEDLMLSAGGARIFIIYHTAPHEMTFDRNLVTLIGPQALAQHVVDLGLTAWVMRKVG